MLSGATVVDVCALSALPLVIMQPKRNMSPNCLVSNTALPLEQDKRASSAR